MKLLLSVCLSMCIPNYALPLSSQWNQYFIEGIQQGSKSIQHNEIATCFVKMDDQLSKRTYVLCLMEEKKMFLFMLLPHGKSF